MRVGASIYGALNFVLAVELSNFTHIVTHEEGGSVLSNEMKPQLGISYQRLTCLHLLGAHTWCTPVSASR